MMFKKQVKQYLQQGTTYTLPEFQKMMENHLHPQSGVYLIHNVDNNKFYTEQSAYDIQYAAYSQFEGRGKATIYMDLRRGCDFMVQIIPIEDQRCRDKFYKAIYRHYKIGKHGYGAMRKLQKG